MQKQTMVIFILVITNFFSALCGYKFYQERETRQLKTFLGIEQKTVAPSTESFFGVTDTNNKDGKNHA